MRSLLPRQRRRTRSDLYYRLKIREGGRGREGAARRESVPAELLQGHTRTASSPERRELTFGVVFGRQKKKPTPVRV
eukprot:3127415-Rhodomonas_salina.1